MRRILTLALILIGLLSTLPITLALAQSSELIPVTADDVNRVSRQLYCPVCPNELLSDCQTQACVQWRAEIRTQLEQGQNDAQIIDSFVDRYGDRVVPIPRDPVLQVMALLTPFLLGAALLGFSAITFVRWRRTPATVVSAPPAEPTDDYRARIERDLNDQ